jgi:hypothetical protein
MSQTTIKPLVGALVMLSVSFGFGAVLILFGFEKETVFR